MSIDQQYILDFVQALATPSLRNSFPILNSINNTNNNTNNNNNKILVDIENNETTLIVYAEIPGIKKEDLDIKFYNNKLTFSVHKTRNYVPEMSEIKFGNFERTLTLPICVTKKTDVKVSYDNGILMLSINKTTEEENKFSIKI